MERHELPNGQVVEFREEDHTYYVDGEQVPSITNLINNYYGNSYSAVNPEILKASADYGTRIHNEIYQLISMRKQSQDIPLVSSYAEVNNYFTFIEDIYKVEPILNEKVVAIYDKGHKVIACGRFDMYCTVGGKPTIVDFKTTSTINRKTVTAQLNLYLLGAYQSGYIDSKDINLAVVHLSGGVTRFVPILKLNDIFCENVLQGGVKNESK